MAVLLTAGAINMRSSSNLRSTGNVSFESNYAIYAGSGGEVFLDTSTVQATNILREAFRETIVDFFRELQPGLAISYNKQ